ncbi:50S ribosomal protein L10 [archaeon]|nr:50S ribosomal protein L10 [archaeon]
MTQAHVADWKKQEVAELQGLLAEYPVVGIVDMTGIPAKQMQRIRASLRGEVLIKMSKKSLMEHALEKAGKEEKSIQEIATHIDGQAAFIFSKMNPFKLTKMLNKSKTPAAAKPNSTAPMDIVLKKGNTPFPPGPFLAELQQFGIDTTIAGGKIAIKKDKTVVKEGEKINAKLADLLGKLGVEPMETGLGLLAAYESGTIFLPDVLSVDEAEVISNIQTAFRNAVSLSMGTGYITKETAPMAISKAHMDALSLAINANIFEPEAMGAILSKANLQMLALASNLSDEALDEELKEAKSKPVQSVKAVKENKSDKAEEAEEEKEEKTEEEAMEGLGALFG